MYRNSHDWKPTPYTVDERAELAAQREQDARDEAEFEAEQARIRAALHPAFAAVAAHIGSGEILGERVSWAVTNAECVAFVLEQVAKVGQRASEALKPELRAIYRDIRARGGDAYAQHKARLQEIAK